MHDRRERTLLAAYAHAVLGLLIAFLVPATLHSQTKAKSTMPADPWTRDSEEDVRKAGWITKEMLQWAPDHDVAAVRRCLTPRPVLALETPHFRILSTLAEQRVDTKDKAGLKLLEAELTLLSKRLDKVEAKRVRRLDPWLRVYLFAQRLEDLRRNFVDLLGPEAAASMAAKTNVLLLERTTELDRYAAQHLQRASAKMSLRHVFDDRTPIIVTAAELGVLQQDRQLAGSVAFNVTHCLFDTYKSNLYELPAWLREGLAHWFAQAIDPDEVNRTTSSNEDITMLLRQDWASLTKKILQSKAMRPLDEIFVDTNFDCMKFRDHIACWSRVDYMVSEHGAAFRSFIDGIKGQFDARGHSLPQSEVPARFQEAFEKSFGQGPTDFDRDWAAWASAKKAKRR